MAHLGHREEGAKVTSKKASTLRCGKVKIGGAEGNRTLDLLNAIEALSQLSYSPTD